MRLTGWILLLIGAVLCATVAWAAVGFLLMGLGLISLQVAERGRHRTNVAVAAPAAGFNAPAVGAGLQPPTLEPVIQHDGQPPPQPRRMAWPARTGDTPYDREAWDQLVASDPDIARLAKVLADYGPHYVDELATNYLVAPEKNRLGGIVDGIIARASGGEPIPPPAPTRASQPASPANPTEALEASLITAVTEASAKRADPPRPPAAPPQRPDATREPDGTSAASPPVPPQPSAPASEADATLLAALAEISGVKLTDATKRDAASTEPPPPPADDELAKMIRTFAQESNVLRKT
ncbi:hypothetical protein [Bradyrhizobium sp. ORS 111]|uniref:hypothetical protein n=1 Tax=Bradyrhizobium sp. ORS 111 TaxID=1685958 RepID=UPI00388F2AF5